MNSLKNMFLVIKILSLTLLASNFIAAMQVDQGYQVSPATSGKAVNVSVAESNRLGQELLLAVKNRNLSQVQELIGSGANLDFEDRNGFTPLGVALFYGYLNIADLLIKNGAKALPKSYEGKKFIIEASRSGDFPILKFLLDNKLADINAKDEKGNTALMLSSLYGHKELADLLIKAGANVNIKNLAGEDALDKAIDSTSRNSGEVAKLLIKAGANVNAKSPSLGISRLMGAIKIGQNDNNILEILIDEGANFNDQDNFGETALMYAIKRGNQNAVKLLLERGARTDYKDLKGITALDKALDLQAEYLYDKPQTLGIQDLAIINNISTIIEMLEAKPSSTKKQKSF